MEAFIPLRDSALVHLGGSRDRAGSTLDRSNGSNWIAARSLPDPQAITTVALVSFMGVVCASGQFIALARNKALASATLERRFPAADRPRPAMAARKWLAVIASSWDGSVAVLASFTQRSAAL